MTVEGAHHGVAVRIVDFPAVRVAEFLHVGPPARIDESVRRFVEWRKSAGLPPRVSATYNVWYDDPETADPATFRLGLCAATDGPIAPNDAGVAASLIPGGRCAVLRVVGGEGALPPAVAFLTCGWLRASRERRSGAPLVFRRVAFPPDVPAHVAVTEIVLPLAER